MTQTRNILIADRSRKNAEQVGKVLDKTFDCTITIASSSAELFDILSQQTFHLAIIDTVMSGDDAPFGDIRLTASHYPEVFILPAIFNDSNEQIAQAIELNLFNYLSKPYLEEEIALISKKVFAIIDARKKIAAPEASKKTAKSTKDNFHGIIGNSDTMKKLFHLISRIADDEFSTVLIRGESGTGKELVAKAIHSHSQRRKKNFVPVNCAAIPDDLLESELFGHTKGAFTGANQNKQGRIQYADGGTLFLDEIGDMKSSLQAKLLRVLQEKEFEPVGALKPIPVDTRILAATHCDLEQLVSEGTFREDLYYRLSVIPLNIPSLRDRSDDIIILLKNFIHKFTTQRGREPFTFTDSAYDCLRNQRWRGNVRELENLVQHMSILYCGEKVCVEDLPEKYQQQPVVKPKPLTPVEMSVQPDERFALQLDTRPEPTAQEPDSGVNWDKGTVDFKELINDFETKLILQAMKMTEGNKKEAARLLNLKRTTLLEKIKKKNLNGLWEN